MRKTALRKMSVKKSKEHRKYILARARWLPGKFCEMPGSIPCVNRADDIHHMNRRTGEMLNDQRFWMAVCRQHHHWIETNKREARKMGVILYK